jgi:hypothetical protein
MVNPLSMLGDENVPILSSEVTNSSLSSDGVMLPGCRVVADAEPAPFSRSKAEVSFTP